MDAEEPKRMTDVEIGDISVHVEDGSLLRMDARHLVAEARRARSAEASLTAELDRLRGEVAELQRLLFVARQTVAEMKGAAK